MQVAAMHGARVPVVHRGPINLKICGLTAMRQAASMQVAAAAWAASEPQYRFGRVVEM